MAQARTYSLKWFVIERTALALLLQCAGKVRLMHPYALSFSELFALSETSFGANWPLELREFEDVLGAMVKRNLIAYNFASQNIPPTDEDRASGGFTITAEGLAYLGSIEDGEFPSVGRFEKKKSA